MVKANAYTPENASREQWKENIPVSAALEAAEEMDDEASPREEREEAESDDEMEVRLRDVTNV